MVPTAAISGARFYWGMPWPKTGATYYHAQIGLLDKGWAIKGFVF